MIIGYTQGAFDLFHVGHLNLIRAARARCDRLVVGVNSDELIQDYKNKTPIIRQEDRMAIVSALKFVDEVVLATTLDKVAMHEIIRFDRLFIGDDWKGNPRWEKTEKEMAEIGVELVWLNYTKGISTTLLRSMIESEAKNSQTEK